VEVTTSDLIRLRYQPHGFNLWLRPNLLEVVTTEQALCEVAEQIEPVAAQRDENDE
jgi:hypothetical protein